MRERHGAAGAHGVCGQVVQLRMVLVLIILAFVTGIIAGALTSRGAVASDGSWVPAFLQRTEEPTTRNPWESYLMRGANRTRTEPSKGSTDIAAPVSEQQPVPSPAAIPLPRASPAAPSPPATPSPSSARPPRSRAAPVIMGSDVDSSYVPTDAELDSTAIVTLATGDEAGRMAVALVQSLRDVHTRVPHIIVLLSTGGVGSKDCHASGVRRCSTSREESDIVSAVYLTALRNLGAELRVIDPLPPTPFTDKIAGGPQFSWGMAFNKLRVFEMTEFRKLLYLDSDVLILQNIDHLMVQPEFTAAYTNDCCNRAASYKISGGMWVFQPSRERFELILDLTRTGKLGEGQEWRLGDMEIVLYMFAKFTRASREDGFWPGSYDLRQGRVPGLELIDGKYALGSSNGGVHAGPKPEALAEARAAGFTPWLPLDVRYDFLVGDCGCMQDRDLGLPVEAAAEIGLVDGPAGSPWGQGAGGPVANLPVEIGRVTTALLSGKRWTPKTGPTGYAGGLISLHYSCLPMGIQKPCKFESEAELLLNVADKDICHRRYSMLWYSKFRRAMGASNPLTPLPKGTSKLVLTE